MNAGLTLRTWLVSLLFASCHVVHDVVFPSVDERVNTQRWGVMLVSVLARLSGQTSQWSETCDVEKLFDKAGYTRTDGGVKVINRPCR